MENFELIEREPIEDTELIRRKTKEQIYMENLYERICFDFEAFNLPATASKKEFERVYLISHAKYLAGKLPIEQWFHIENSYDRLCHYYKQKKQEELKEKERQKREIQWETEKMQRQIEAKQQEELRKGPLWVTLEALKNQEFQMPVETFWESIKTQILNVLNPEAREKYQEFLLMFLDLWDHLYQKICKGEYEECKIINLSLDGSRNMSIGMDELTMEKYELGRYSRLFENAKFFSQMIPDSDDYYFLNAHFQLIANYMGIDYKMEIFWNIPIFSFLITSRIQKAKQQFLTRFGEEVRNGVRENCFVDFEEMLADIKRQLVSYNALFELPEKKPKMIQTNSN